MREGASVSRPWLASERCTLSSWHARARHGEPRSSRRTAVVASARRTRRSSRGRLLPRRKEDERAPFRDLRGGRGKAIGGALSSSIGVGRDTRHAMGSRATRVVNGRSAYLEFVGHGVGFATRSKFWPGRRRASARARSARVSQKAAEKARNEEFACGRLREFGAFTSRLSGTACLSVSRAEGVRLSVDTGRSRPRRSPGVRRAPR